VSIVVRLCALFLVIGLVAGFYLAIQVFLAQG
jgi:uncharacterized protein YneF (UPF0154 family)